MARRAIFHAVVEFIEADRIHLDDFARLGQALRAYDKDMVMEEPSLRPSWIGSISGLGRHVYNDADWLNQIDAGGILIETLTSDGRVILAEETRLKSLEWESPSEMRLSVVESLVESRPPIGEEGEQFFFRIINQVVADYVNINPNEAPIIIRNYGSGYHSAGVDWLALNPAIGLKLGWNLSNEGLFRWVNKQGEIMVESIWWMDGLPDHSPPIGDEVGEGWQVVGSQSAIEQIRKETASLTRVTCVLRKYTKGERTERNEWLKTFYSQ